MSEQKELPTKDTSLFRTDYAQQNYSEDLIQDKEIITRDKISYLWKTFEVKNRSLQQMVDEHEYVAEPEKSIGYQFFMLHLVSYCIYDVYRVIHTST